MKGMIFLADVQKDECRKYFFNKIFSCYTTVGRMPGQNIVMLESNNLATCIEHDIVIHELMHTVIFLSVVSNFQKILDRPMA